MENLARLREPACPRLEYGYIVSTGDGPLTVETPYDVLEALPAAGCLIRPEVGDLVLLAINESRVNYVLSVLDRSDDRPTTLEVDGDLALRVKGGGLTLAPDGEMVCVSTALSVHAEKGEAVFNRFFFVGRLLKSQIERVKSVAGMVDAVCREMTIKTVNYFRFTSDHEDCQAKSRRQLVDETLAMQSKNTVIMSEEDVKIDGKLIHVG